MPSPKVLCKIIALLSLLSLCAGCRLILGTAAVGVGTVGLAGFTVYKVGEAAVVTTGSAVAAGAEGVQAVVYSGGDLKLEYPAQLAHVYGAAYVTFQEMQFASIDGKQDGLTGRLQARTVEDEIVMLELEQLEGQKTALSLKVGKKGDLKKSQIIYSRMLAILDEAGSATRSQ